MSDSPAVRSHNWADLADEANDSGQEEPAAAREKRRRPPKAPGARRSARPTPGEEADEWRGVDGDAASAQAFQMPSPTFSVGSRLHAAGRCKPCVFFHTKGCRGGTDCPFCHLCPPGEKMRRKRLKQHLLAQLERRVEKQGGGAGAAGQADYLSRESSTTSFCSTVNSAVPASAATGSSGWNSGASTPMPPTPSSSSGAGRQGAAAPQRKGVAGPRPGAQGGVRQQQQTPSVQGTQGAYLCAMPVYCVPMPPGSFPSSKQQPSRPRNPPRQAPVQEESQTDSSGSEEEAEEDCDSESEDAESGAEETDEE